MQTRPGPLRIPEDLWVSMNDEPDSARILLRKKIPGELQRLGVRPVHYQRSGLVQFIARAAGKLGLVRPLVRFKREAVVLVSPWGSNTPYFGPTYFHEVIPFIYDCWGQQFDRWEALLRRHRVRTAFFTARIARDEFASRIPGLEAFWTPEACDPALFTPDTPLAQRSIHVLEMGRKYHPVHNCIRPALASAGHRHLFSSPQQPELFKDTDELYRAMGDSMVCICYPKSLTNPQGAGGVETMTQRYLEAIGSGAIAAGACPKELEDLFGFNPVIELPADSPEDALLDVLRRPADFQPHADRCRKRLLEVGTFEVRARDMLDILVRTRGQEAGLPTAHNPDQAVVGRLAGDLSGPAEQAAQRRPEESRAFLGR